MCHETENLASPLSHQEQKDQFEKRPLSQKFQNSAAKRSRISNQKISQAMN
jgi:hypothetical protein